MAELFTLNFDELKEVIKSGDQEKINSYLEEKNLYIKDGKIYPKNIDDVKYAQEYWDKKQHVTKINLNSLYGAILNNGCRFNDKRIGQSTTLTGRQIVKHMSAKVNEVITGDYDHSGTTVIYGDSVTGDTIIRTDNGDKTIEQLYSESLEFSKVDDKEYGLWNQSKVLGFDSYEMKPIISNLSYIMRHKTKKKLYKITTENGKSVTVTEDHSIIVDRDGNLVECKPNQILSSDLIITFETKNKTQTINEVITWMQSGQQ